MDGRLNKTERLIKIWLLLLNNPAGYTVKQLAGKFEVNVRTIYRDLVTLGNDLQVPVYADKTKWKIDEKRILPPLRFTLPEALNVFLAARLMLNYSHRFDPNIDATFTKLSSALPPALGEQVRKTLDWMEKLPRDDRYLRTMAKLAEAWATQRRLKISYRALPAEKDTERIIEPYFIEPATPGHASYVIAYCHRTQELRVFKVERIESIEMTDETYTIPVNFDANQYFSAAWGIVVKGEEQTVRLRFIPELARLMKESIWHPSQILEEQADGSIIMTLRVTDTMELRSWILGWGEKVEVLEPAELRRKVLQTARATVEVYQQ